MAVFTVSSILLFHNYYQDTRVRGCEGTKVRDYSSALRLFEPLLKQARVFSYLRTLVPSHPRNLETSKPTKT